VAPLWERFRTRPEELIATALAFTVEATARAYEEHVLPRFPTWRGCTSRAAGAGTHT